jgi:hypothetical protein
VLKAILFTLATLSAVVPAAAEKVVIAKYHTKEAATATYAAVIRATVESKFTLRSTDKAQQTIQAYRTAWGDGAEFASVFITVTGDEHGSDVEAIFTRHAGIVGGGSPNKWATDLGDELTRTIPDLTFEVHKR